LSGLGFGAGTWYSLSSDRFHDFFTEYIPFGEDAVLYFEEREFRKRFPNAASARSGQIDTGERVTIPSNSGLSWRISEEGGSNLETRGPHNSALEANTTKKAETTQQATTTKPSEQKDKKDSATPKKKAESKTVVAKGDAKAAPAPAKDASITKATETKPKPDESKDEVQKPTAAKAATSPAPVPATGSKLTPEVNEPSVYVPLTRIDPLAIKNADEPVVQDLVKILNDIITVVNADTTAPAKYNSTISKAKSELANVGQKIVGLKSEAMKQAEEEFKSMHSQFDDAARELVRRLEDEMKEQESRWKEEFNAERAKISQSYEDRLAAEVKKAKELADKTVRNQLLEQAVALKKQFAHGVTEQVETERSGRLAKLSELSSSVNELEKLTAEWNNVINANLQTQHLQVAVEAVRATLERADRPRPFIKELAALKEIAANDPVVNSAIASINPIAYQRGVPTPAQLIDRFRRVATEVRKASLLPEDAGVASHAASLVLSKVMFKKQGRAVGDDVESILTRTETLLEEGNLDEAAREMNGLKGWAKTLSGDWLGEVRRVLEVRQAMDVSRIPL
jgi:mitofilin